MLLCKLLRLVVCQATSLPSHADIEQRLAELEAEEEALERQAELEGAAMVS
jgi:hypothetical protein